MRKGMAGQGSECQPRRSKAREMWAGKGASESTTWDLQARLWNLSSITSALGIFVKFMSQIFSWVVVTNCHRLDDGNNKYFFLIVWRMESQRSGCWQIQCLVMAWFMVCRCPFYCAFTWRRGEKCPLLIRALIPSVMLHPQTSSPPEGPTSKYPHPGD